MNKDLITKEYINDTIRPFTPSDALFEATLFEALALDLLPVIGRTRVSQLQSEDPFPDELVFALERGLKRCLGYFIYSRCLRTASATITKYGTTIKESDYSNPTGSQKIVSDSDYYKKIGQTLLSEFKDLNIDQPVCSCGSSSSRNSDSGWFNSKIIGD